MNNAVTVIVAIQAKPEDETRVEAAVLDVLAPTRAEPGCLRYDFYRNKKQAGALFIIGEFADVAAIERHDATPHLSRLKQAIGPLAAIQVTRLDRIN